MSASAPTIAVIGGSGLYTLHEATAVMQNVCESVRQVETPYSTAPVILYLEHTDSGPVWFLPRHGRDHSVAPHEINYRANLWALQQVGVRKIIAINAVGGINARFSNGVLVLPDQIIDYSWGRDHTFFSGTHAFDKHIDFTYPYDAALGEALAQAAKRLDLTLHKNAVYACTQGPRLETAAEIRKLERDGCDIVGMTGMPEAALARELDLAYACVALVVNRAAGLEAGLISLDTIRHVLEAGITDVKRLLLETLTNLQTAQQN